MVREETTRNAYGAVRVYSDTDCGRIHVELVIRIIRPIEKDHLVYPSRSIPLYLSLEGSRGKIR